MPAGSGEPAVPYAGARDAVGRGVGFAALRVTHVPTWRGFICVAFVVATLARRIVGWQASPTAHAGFVLDATEQALHARPPARSGGLIIHSDRGSQYLSIRYTERLAVAGIEPSVGGVGDSHDNALAEPIGNIPPAEAEERYHAMINGAAIAA